MLNFRVRPVPPLHPLDPRLHHMIFDAQIKKGTLESVSLDGPFLQIDFAERESSWAISVFYSIYAVFSNKN